jgi:hypothetical protein
METNGPSEGKSGGRHATALRLKAVGRSSGPQRPGEDESRWKKKKSGKQPGGDSFCTLGPRSSESDTEPLVLRQSIAMTGRNWIVKITAGAVHIGKSRDRPGCSPQLVSQNTHAKTVSRTVEVTAREKLQIEIVCLQIERRATDDALNRPRSKREKLRQIHKSISRAVKFS